MRSKVFIILFLVVGSCWAMAAKKMPVKTTTKTENFESQLVEGQIYRPDLSVVTGDTDKRGFGVLRLRSSFEDHAKNDRGELIK